jgi:hypothetical protein
MACIYEFAVNRKIIKEIVKDTNLSLASDAKGNLVDNLISIINRPATFQKAYMDGKPGICIRVGQIRTERFEGQGLHMFIIPGRKDF